MRVAGWNSTCRSLEFRRKNPDFLRKNSCSHGRARTDVACRCCGPGRRPQARLAAAAARLQVDGLTLQNFLHHRLRRARRPTAATPDKVLLGGRMTPVQLPGISTAEGIRRQAWGAFHRSLCAEGYRDAARPNFRASARLVARCKVRVSNARLGDGPGARVRFEIRPFDADDDANAIDARYQVGRVRGGHARSGNAVHGHMR